MSIQLLNKRILLKQIKKEDTGIINPDSIESFVVYKTGDQVSKVNKGDSVMYENGRKFLVKGEEYILTDEDNIVCKL